MAFSGKPLQKRDEVIAIDLGAQITKAARVRRRGDGFSLLDYVLIETPIFEKIPSRDLLVEHLRKVSRAIGAGGKKVVFVIGTNESLLCHADLPASSPSELRKMIKLSPKAHLRQDLPDHQFDCYVPQPPTSSTDTAIARARRKAKVLVGAARRRWIENLQEASRDVGLTVEQITLSQVGVVNAFKMLPEDSHADVVALLDVGFVNSTIGIVAKGEFLLTRVVNIGAQKISEALSRMGGDSQAGGDPKAGLGDDVQAKLQRSIGLIAKEIHASVNFFETQHDLKVTQVFVSGGAARSQFVLQSLEQELEVPCESWTPTQSLSLDLAPARRSEVEYDGPQLSVAIGGALGYLNPGLITINLLAEEQEVIEMRRRDPIRRALWVAGGVVFLALAWAGYAGVKLWRNGEDLKRFETERQALEKTARQANNDARLAVEMGRTLNALDRVGTNRFLWAPVLNALQYTTVPQIQFHYVRIDQAVANSAPPTANAGDSKSASVTEKTVITIRGRNYGDSRTIDRLVEVIAANPYFKERLRAVDPVLLKQLDPRQVDPSDPNRSFVLFTLECTFKDRILKDE